MARSSHGPRLATTTAVAQKSLPMPRLVRLGRPANDNFRPRRMALRMVVAALATAATVIAAAHWNLI